MDKRNELEESIMKIGDLVKSKATWSNATGIVMQQRIGGFWILWFCGTWGFHNSTDVEVIA